MDDQTAEQLPRLRGPQLASRGLARLRLTRLLLVAGGLVLTAVLAVVAAIEITPMQTVTVAGQVIKVGTALRPSTSGPGRSTCSASRWPRESRSQAQSGPGWS